MMTSTIEAAPGPSAPPGPGRQMTRSDSVRSRAQHGGASGGRHGRFRCSAAADGGHRDRPRGAVRVHAARRRSSSSSSRRPPRSSRPTGGAGAGRKELVADLALEGGGVKGIGIVGAVSVLAEAGYRFQRVAGTSAGAIAASLIAAISKKGDSMTTLQGYLDDLTFTEFMHQGQAARVHGPPLRQRRREPVGSPRSSPTRWASTTANFLFTWLEPIMHGLGVHTFADLKITMEDDPGMSLPESRRYGLVVHTPTSPAASSSACPGTTTTTGRTGTSRTSSRPCARPCRSRSSSSRSPSRPCRPTSACPGPAGAPSPPTTRAAR